MSDKPDVASASGYFDRKYRAQLQSLTMELYILIGICLLILLVAVQIILLPKGKNTSIQLLQKLESLSDNLSRIETNVKDDFRVNREESALLNRENRLELGNSLKDFSSEQKTKFEELKTEQKELTLKTIENLEKITLKVEDKLGALTRQAAADNKEMRESIEKSLKEFQLVFDKNVSSFNDLQREKFGQLEEKQQKLIESTEKKLEEMRITVDEKLQKTLNERLGQSFEMVGKQLESVQKGLGEMQTLAQDVGGLKRVLSNVKMRGGFGEVQLAMLLEQVLAPEQYEANVCTKKSSNDVVEFAIKLPGKNNGGGNVWLPIDAKFPRDAFEQLQNAYDTGELAQVETAQKILENAIKKMARDISEKYIDPPFTTDFAIMFLPFEGIYAEVVRKASLLEELQRTHKVIVTGPTTLAAILNSLQMGFRTLAIQKRSGEVWKILGAVKKEFENFGGMLEKAQKNIRVASDQIDEVMGKRTRAIQRKLKDVEVLGGEETKGMLPDASAGEEFEDENE